MNVNPVVRPGWYKFSFAVFFFASCMQSGPSTSQATDIPAPQLKTDFQVFRKTAEEAHPGIYWYTSRKDMDAYFDSVYVTIDKPMNDIHFFKLMMTVVARLQCVHTSVSLPEERERAAASALKLLPFDVIVANNKVYVSHMYPNRQLAGLQIHAINDLPIAQILQKMFDVIPADGYNITSKYQLLNNGRFRRLYALLLKQSDKFRIGVTDSTNKPIDITVEAVAPDLSIPQPVREDPINWNFQQGDSLAVLTIRSFILNSDRFTRIIDSFFVEAKNKKTNRLIIDMRNNGGGNNVNVSVLYSYLAEKPFYHLRGVEPITRNLSQRNYILNISEYDIHRSRIERDSTFELDRQYPGRVLRQPVTINHFNGKLIVLANGATISAGSEFVALVHGNKRGIVIGEETGGCYYGSTGGNYLALVLPNSRLRLRIPTIRIFTAVPEDFERQPPGRGVLPDYPVSHSIEDLISGRDGTMELALQKSR